MITSSEEEVQGALAMVHLKVLFPVPSPVIPEVGELGEVMLPVPDINVQVPAPTVGVFPAKVAVEAHIFWSGPALEIVGASDTMTEVVFTGGAAAQALLAVKV